MRRIVYAACILTFSAAMFSPCSAAEFTARDLANKEAKFAAYSVKNGMRAAFLEFFAAQSWLLRPELVDAQAWIRGRPNPPIVLDWKSQRTVMSASGDLGFSTGPSIYRSKADLKAPAEHGQFFSVWQKQKDGQWKVLFDHGISHGPSTTPDSLPTTPLTSLDLIAHGSAEPVFDAEKDFLDRTDRQDSRLAYLASVNNHTVLLRDGLFPITGKTDIMAHLNSLDGKWSWTPKLRGVSSANDFAYVVGSYVVKLHKGETRKGQYVRVWIRDVSAQAPMRWTIAGEIMTPEPAPKP